MPSYEGVDYPFGDNNNDPKALCSAYGPLSDYKNFYFSRVDERKLPKVASNQGKRMSESSGWDVLGAVCGVLLLMYWPFWHFDVAPFSDSKTFYVQTCVSDAGETCRWRNGGLRTFKVAMGNQAVVEFRHQDSSVEAHAGCVVFDRNNWRCPVNAGSGVQGFSEGDFLSPLPGNIRAVSKTRWWLAQLKNA